MGKNFSDPVARLLEAFPDVSALTYFAEDQYHYPGAYFVFGAFRKYLVALQESGLDQDKLRKGYELIEAMEATGDSELHNLVGIEICERLALQEFLDLAEPHMGPATKRLAAEFATAHDRPLPGQSGIYDGVDIQRYQELYREELDKLGGPENAHEFDVSELRDQTLRRLKGRPRHS